MKRFSFCAYCGRVTAYKPFFRKEIRFIKGACPCDVRMITQTPLWFWE